MVPNLCNDGHDCSAATADDWLRSWLPVIEKGRDFTSRRLATVVTWDEDDDHSSNHILLAVIHPSLQGKEVATRLDHYGLSASVTRVSRFASLRNADKETTSSPPSAWHETRSARRVRSLGVPAMIMV